MKNKLLLALALLLCFANIGDAKVLTNDPLTGLPLIPDTSSGKYTDNEPTGMPKAMVCKSSMQGNFYSLYNITLDAATSWYSAHLPGFKKAQGYESHRSQVAFYNADRTMVVIITSESGPQSGSAKAYSVAYERYQPGLGEKTVIGLTQGHMFCP